VTSHLANVSLEFVPAVEHPQPPNYAAIKQASDERLKREAEEAAHVEAARVASEALEAQRQAEAARIVPVASVTFSPQYNGTHGDWMAAAGIAVSDYSNMDYIISRESGWRVDAQNPSSSAYGLCQSLPARKMASAGPDYLTSPTTQLKWCYNYGISRYGSLSNAVSFWQQNRWW
jgi:hypothetical protein